MKRNLTTLLLMAGIILGLLPRLNAQVNHTLTATIKGFADQKVNLAGYKGDRNYTIDTVLADHGGKVIFNLKSSLQPGLYRLQMGKDKFIDFIYNNEDISLSTSADNLVDSMQVLVSRENKIYYKFIQSEKTAQIKLELLSPLVSYYPQEDPFYAEALKQFTKAQTDRDNFVAGVLKSNPNTFVSRMLKVQRTLILDPKLTDEARFNFLKKHFLENVDFTDTLLLNTNVYADKVISYLSLYRDRQLGQTDQEKEFVKAVEIILNKAQANQKVYDFVLDYLVRGFEKFKFENVLAYISDTYVNKDKCENETRKTSLQKRLEGYAKLAVGKPAPPLQVTDVNGQEVTVGSLQTEYTLVLFYASWCPHCNELLPELSKIYQAQNPKRLEVIAISIDTSRTAWNDFLKKGNYRWINSCDLKGWDGKAALDYNLYATPTMVVVDRQKKIAAKPITLAEVKDFLIQKGILKQ